MAGPLQDFPGRLNLFLFGDLLVLCDNSLQRVDDQQVGPHASNFWWVCSFICHRSHLLSCAWQTDQKLG